MTAENDGPRSVGELRALLTEHGLPEPPLVVEFADRLEERQPRWWTTDPALLPDVPFLVALSAFEREAPSFGVGFTGRGMTSNALGWVLLARQLHIVLELGIGNYGDDRAADVARVEARFVALGDLLAAARETGVAPGRALVVVESDFTGRTWGIVEATSTTDELEAAPWPQSSDALGEATSVLRST